MSKAMISVIILLLSIHHNQAATLTQNGNHESGKGTMDENGVCHCTVVLPDTTLPADRMQSLEISIRNLSISVEKEATKIYSYENTLAAHVEQLKNLTKRVEVMEHGGLSYTQLDFELINLEIREMEVNIEQLKTSMNGSNVIIETLHQEIRNISAMASKLETYDKNNVLVIRREVEALKKRLRDCEKSNFRPGQPSLPPDDYATCEHGEITKVKHSFVQWNRQQHVSGGWGKDSFPGTDQNTYWVATSADGRPIISFCLYPSYDDLLLYKNCEEKRLYNSGNGGSAYYGQGGGMIVYNGSMYYTCYNTGNICRYDIKQERVLNRNGAFSNRFSYYSVAGQEIDIASDESGLWAIYATEATIGNIVISKINPISLMAEKTWNTTQYKAAATNAFMACGVLYATRPVSKQTEEIFYMYDTKTMKESRLSVPFDKLAVNVQSLSYNPNDHKLYMYNDGYQMRYDLTFKPQSDKKSQI